MNTLFLGLFFRPRGVCFTAPVSIIVCAPVLLGEKITHLVDRTVYIGIDRVIPNFHFYIYCLWNRYTYCSLREFFRWPCRSRALQNQGVFLLLRNFSNLHLFAYWRRNVSFRTERPTAKTSETECFFDLRCLLST